MNPTIILMDCGCANIDGITVSRKSRTARTRNKFTKLIRF